MIDEGKHADDLPHYLLDLSADGVYVDTCERGHPLRLVLQNLQYELLYESGIMALLSGFNLQAVSSMATALERFFEFAIRVLLLRNEMPPEDLDTAWKAVVTSSERQYGAFLFLYLAATKKPYARENPRMVEFRNRVVHRGEIPSAQKVRDYAKYVYEIVRDVRAELVALDREAVVLAEWQANRRARGLLDQKAPSEADAKGRCWSGASAHFEMVLSTLNVGAPTDFDTRLNEAESRMVLWGLRQPPPNERRETSRVGTFLITEYSFATRHFLEASAGEGPGAPTVRAEISETDLEDIRKLPEKAERAKALGAFIDTHGVPIEPAK